MTWIGQLIARYDALQFFVEVFKITLQHLKINIQEEVANIPVAMLEKATANATIGFRQRMNNMRLSTSYSFKIHIAHLPISTDNLNKKKRMQ